MEQKEMTKLVEALRCKSLSKRCDSCGYGYHLSPDSECNDACHVEQIYADAAAAIEELQQIADHYEQTAKDYWKEACEYKAQLPKRGEWMNVTDSYFWYGRCSVCGAELNVDGWYAELMNYCPKCGAKMDGERKEGEE